MRHSLLGLSLVLACVSSFGGDSVITTRKLPNGMTVVVAVARTDDAVAIHLTFDAGARLDPPGHPGAAWFVSRVISQRLRGFTADLNQERAIFATVTPLSKLDDSLELIREAFRSEAITPAEFDRTQQELNDEMRVGGGASLPEETLLSLVYQSHPHAHAAKSNPQALRRADAEEFLSKHYRPSSGVAALAGSFEGSAVIARVSEALAKLPRRGQRKRCKPYNVKLSGERSRTIGAAAARQVEIHIGYPTAAAPSADWYALNILADVIGQGPESRLQRALVRSGMAVDFAEGETESPCTASLLRMRARVNAGREVSEVKDVIDRELTRLRQEPITEQELTTARNQERAWAAEQVSTASGLASAAARAELFYGDAARTDTDIERMSKVSAADVLRVARKYLQPSNRGIVMVTPSAGEK